MRVEHRECNSGHQTGGTITSRILKVTLGEERCHRGQGQLSEPVSFSFMSGAGFLVCIQAGQKLCICGCSISVFVSLQVPPYVTYGAVGLACAGGLAWYISGQPKGLPLN